MPKTRKVYALCEPDTGEVRYVGISQNPHRRLSPHMASSSLRKRDVPLTRWLKGLKEQGLKPFVLTLEEVPEEQWREAECKWIAYYLEQGADLTNISPGGYMVGEETRLKMSANSKRRHRNLSEATKERQRTLAKRFYEENPEERRKASERAKSTWGNPEWRARQTELMRGKSRPGAHGPFGERNGSAKLTAAQVQEIRSLFAQGNITKLKLASLYGVSKTTIRKIVQRKNWQEVA